MSDYKLKQYRDEMEKQRRKVVENNQGSVSDFLFDKISGGSKPYDVAEDKMNQASENIIEKSKKIKYKRLKELLKNGDK
jgi:cytochrome c556